MPKKHISVVKAVAIWIVAVVMILFGFVGMFSGLPTGFGLLLCGFVLAGINKLVFRVRTKQLQIDTREGIRDKIGYVCPDCGQRISEGSKFCNNCGFKVS